MDWYIIFRIHFWSTHVPLYIYTYIYNFCIWVWYIHHNYLYEGINNYSNVINSIFHRAFAFILKVYMHVSIYYSSYLSTSLYIHPSIYLLIYLSVTDSDFWDPSRLSEKKETNQPNPKEMIRNPFSYVFRFVL